MNFGDKFRAIFEAKYKDLASDIPQDYYINTNLNKEVENLSWDLLVTMHTEFQRICTVMRDKRLKCEHPKDKIRNYHNLEICDQCKCSRVLNECEESMFNTWSEWDC